MVLVCFENIETLLYLLSINHCVIFPLSRCLKSLQRRHAWIRALLREDFGHLKAVYVCLKHFHEEDILSSKRRQNTEIPRAMPMLREGAITSLLPACPSYYSTSSSKKTCLSFDSKEEIS